MGRDDHGNRGRDRDDRQEFDRDRERGRDPYSGPLYRESRERERTDTRVRPAPRWILTVTSSFKGKIGAERNAVTALPAGPRPEPSQERSVMKRPSAWPQPWPRWVAILSPAGVQG